MENTNTDGQLNSNELPDISGIVQYNKKMHPTVVDCINMMLKNIDHGSSWKTEELARILRSKPKSPQFRTRLNHVQNFLIYNKGMHLSAKGKNENEYFIEERQQTEKLQRRWERDMIGTAKRIVAIGVSALREYGDELSEMNRFKIEKRTELAAKRLLFIISVKPTIKRPRPKKDDK